MTLTMYGMMLCPDCEEAVNVLNERQISYTFADFTKDTVHLKTFLKIRDNNPLFDDVRREGNIGIPCFVFDNGTVLLDLNDAIEYIESDGKNI